MKKLKPIHEIYLIAIWISIQIIVGTIVRRELITENWEMQFYLIVGIFVIAQFVSIMIYMDKKYF